MALCAASVAGICLAADGVESANIVGYQEFGGNSTFNMTAATFVPVGTDGSTMKLGDLQGNDLFDPTSDTVSIFDGGSIVLVATYISSAIASDLGVIPGWYDYNKLNGSEFENVDNTSILAGVGFVFNRATDSARVIVKKPVIQ